MTVIRIKEAHMITLIIGKSAAGKDTLLKQMISNGKEPIVSYTT